MEERRYGGARRISGGPRPTSKTKTRKVGARKLAAAGGPLPADSSKAPHFHHNATSFPLFSGIEKIAAPTGFTANRNKQLTKHGPRCGQNVSPVPVEVLQKSRSRPPSASASGKAIEVLSRYSSKYGSQGANGAVDYFPFQSLPDDCKLKVFSYLSSLDKGRAAQVCCVWWELMSASGLWSHITFSELPFWCITSDEHNCLGNCYVRYRVRVKKFFTFLRNIRPILRSLEFKFDVADTEDGYMQPLEKLLTHSNLHELKYACLNWKETPVRPFWSDITTYVRCDEVVQKHRQRQRLFLNFFFDPFTKLSPKLETLITPFDWSERAVKCLLRLRNLHSLVLEKYFVFLSLSQDLLDKLLHGLPVLRRLMIEVWTASSQGLVLFSLASQSLEYLDISQSRGFYVSALDMPRLKRFRVARQPWHGPLVLREDGRMPCLYNILVEGAPNLCKINDHYLEPRWREVQYGTLEEVLKGVCSCRFHKIDWAM